MRLILLLLCFGGLSVSARPSLGSQLKHGATCDCFIVPQHSRSTLDELLQILTNEIVNTTTFKPILPTSNVTIPEPKLIVINPPVGNASSEENRLLRPPKHRFVPPKPLTTPSPKPQSSPLTIDDVFAFLKQSQEKLKAYGWLPPNYQPLRRLPSTDPTNRMQDAPIDADPTSLFSLKHGFVSRNLVQAGRLMKLFDQFDCRCAGNFGSIIDAKKFVRFTVSHV